MESTTYLTHTRSPKNLFEPELPTAAGLAPSKIKTISLEKEFPMTRWPVLIAATLFTSGIAAAAEPKLLFQKPTLSATQIAFVYAGDLWIVAREGGAAHRLTASAGIETRPYFSPDGKSIAFTGEYDGNVDVYVVAAAGGVPRRLTCHPSPDQTMGWTPDGKGILFSSPRASYSGFSQLFTVSRDDSLLSQLPLTIAPDR